LPQEPQAILREEPDIDKEAILEMDQSAWRSLSRFFWQRGYGVFSVSPSQLEPVLQYIETQQEHHRTRTFEEEYRELLRRHGIDFDERYVWDWELVAWNESRLSAL